MYFDVAQRLFKEESRGGEKIAFVASEGELSWNELKKISGEIAKALEKAGVRKGARVLVYGDKEIFFLAAILACYRSKFTFIPVSPGLPVKRVESMIQQSAAEVMVVCGAYANVPRAPLALHCDLSVEQNVNYAAKTFEEDAYILFTSGSTGTPKGVRISAENITAFVNDFTQAFAVNERTVFINRADLNFDISLADLFGTLQTGGTGVFNTASHVKHDLFFERIKKYKGNHWNSTPSFVASLFPHKEFQAKALPSIETFVLSGENLPVSLVKELRSRFPQAKTVNAYGPTETCIFASYAGVTDDLLQDDKLPVSKLPAKNLSLEEDEIIISGRQVGPGYLNDAALTTEKFAGGKYHSGDRGLVKNGFLYYNGRTDDQIKLNGYRIELGDIRSALEKRPNVVQAECLPIEINGIVKRLVAFVIAKDTIDPLALKKELAEMIPSYMIPSEIIAMSEFPVNASLKTDRKKLLEFYLGA